MNTTIAVERVERDPVEARHMEFVERKGIGHPDSLSDGVAEAVSRRLSIFYRSEFGRILHHGTDKVHLGAGRAEPSFGDTASSLTSSVASRSGTAASLIGRRGAPSVNGIPPV